jgi:CHASE3 domain sensor protein
VEISKKGKMEEAIKKTLIEIDAEEKGRKLSAEDAKKSLMEEIRKTLRDVQTAEQKAKKNQEEEKDNQ